MNTTNSRAKRLAERIRKARAEQEKARAQMNAAIEHFEIKTMALAAELERWERAALETAQ